MSTADRLQALRELSTILKEKGDVPPELWGSAGVKTNARLKDVEKEIVAVKKNVSKGIKTKCKEDQRKELEEEATRQGVSVDELLGKNQNEREFNDQLKKNRERVREEDRVKKEMQRRTDLGEHDMVVDYV